MSNPVIQIQRIEQAKQACAQRGIAMDGVYANPGEVYRKAISKMGRDASSLRGFDHTDAAKVVFDALQRRPAKPRIAADAAAAASFATMFPHAHRLRSA